MGLVAEETGSKREPAPAGTHIATCFGLIDLGTQDKTYPGKEPRKSPELWVWFELAEEKTEDGKPVTVGSFYTRSLSEKANLRKHLESWRGRPFTEEELRGFNLRNVLGKSCMVTIMHEPKKTGGVRDKIASVTALPKGMKAEPPASPVVTLDLDDGKFNRATYEALPKFLKDVITKSPEGRAALGLTAGATTATNNQTAGDTDPNEDIPF